MSIAKTNRRARIMDLEYCSNKIFGDVVVTTYSLDQTERFDMPVLLTNDESRTRTTERPVTPITYTMDVEVSRAIERTMSIDSGFDIQRRRASELMDQLLLDIYSDVQSTTDYNSGNSGGGNFKSSSMATLDLHKKGVDELQSLVSSLSVHVERIGSVLVRQLKRRDALRRQQEAHCDVISSLLAKCAPSDGALSGRFALPPSPPLPGADDQWSAAMRTVAALPGGVPPEFRRRLWLALAERHLTARSVDWPRAENTCFSEWAHSADTELGAQIVKDLHRTGCSLFSGEGGRENQAMLRRVLLAYARWNKQVGYCQGFNMLAALILQVTESCERDALKLMIYLIEGVLPEHYFADSLRGLSVDMAVFRELLKDRLPRLSKHLETLQTAAKDGAASYEPPLTNVFTMQWFLTLFCNCLPQPTVLRVWDLILLEGNEILLRTALAIWQHLAEKIMHVRSADEFYCIMGVLTRELLEFNLIDANTLIKTVVTIGPLTELPRLREKYIYNINPWGAGVSNFSSSDDKQLKVYPKEKLALDISALKKQYLKLKQRQRQAHIIFSAAINRQPPPSTPVAMNHLLLGKSALVPAKRLGPPKGTIPPVRHPPSTLHWKDAPKQDSSSSSSDTELCDDPGLPSSDEEDDKNLDNESTSQLQDNLVDHSVDLMTLDETVQLAECSGSAFKPSDVVLAYTDDVCDGASSSSVPDFDFKKYDLESDDDFDFEQFLHDRVNRLNKADLASDESDKEEDRMSYSRRNSTRALQIIQENSVILHRILQCQSRSTPSPPLSDPLDSKESSSEENNFVASLPDLKKSVSIESNNTMTPSSPVAELVDKSSFEGNESEVLSPSSSLHRSKDIIDTEDSPEPISIETTKPESNITLTKDSYDIKNFATDNTVLSSSPYVPGIERSITEHFKCDNPVSYDAIEIDTANTDLTSDVNKENFAISPQIDDKSPEYGSRYVSILEKSKNLSEKYNNLIGNASKRPPMSLPLNDSNELRSGCEFPAEMKGTWNNEDGLVDRGEISENNLFDSPEKQEKHQESKVSQSTGSTSPEKLPDFMTGLLAQGKKLSSSSNQETLLKSPSKVFSPFPVQVSSRQSKDVPLKLGLYKK